MKPHLVIMWFLVSLAAVSCGDKKAFVPVSPSSAEEAYDRMCGELFSRPVTPRELASYQNPEAIERLISGLRSLNGDPNLNRNDWTEGYSTNFDFKAQMKVHEAERILIALGTNAFPQLINHADEEPFSKADWYADLLSFSVGAVCEEIIRKQVQLGSHHYKGGRLGVDGKYHSYNPYLDSKLWLPGDPPGLTRKDRLSRWWNTQKERSLREIQIEGLEYFAANEEAIGFPGGEFEKKRYLEPFLKKLKEFKN